MTPWRFNCCAVLLLLSISASFSVHASQEADLILHNGKVVTVDPKFSIAEALAVKDGKILAVGKSDQVLAKKGVVTKIVDLSGKTVLPGLIDSHAHPNGASLTEFDHPIPEMETIADVLAYVRNRAETAKPGEWIVLSQVFITRLREQRYPTKAELDEAAPRNPVDFATGPDDSVNSLALKESGIGPGFKFDGPGKVEFDPKTGEPTGILRNCRSALKIKPTGKKPTDAEKEARLLELLNDYLSTGITSIIDRDASKEDVERYRKLDAEGKLPIRVAISRHIDVKGGYETMTEIRRVSMDPLVRGTSRLRIIGVKTYLDGGMLTGSAYMLEPWGVSKIYSIDDPSYRGVRFIPHELLVSMASMAATTDLQFTAHSVGDGAVTALLDAYEEVNKLTPIAKTRPCITHSNFMTKAAIAKAKKLGVVIDVQPAWLYLDSRTLQAHFGYDRLRWFQPLKSLFEAGVVVGGGSDHMQKIGSMRSINPYNPYLGMWITIARRGKGSETPFHPEEALTREQAIQFYTINNAKIMFMEDKIGSIEPGKFADLVVLDRDLLTCPLDEMKDAKLVTAFSEGRETRVQRSLPAD